MADQVTDNDFETMVLQAKTPVLVDFWAPWCGPCRAIATIIDELSVDYAGRLQVLKLNVDENSVIAGKYGIRSIPTLILFDKGEVIEQITGAVSKASIEGMIAKKVS